MNSAVALPKSFHEEFVTNYDFCVLVVLYGGQIPTCGGHRNWPGK